VKRVVVLGGGPAGAYTAERLSSAGVETVLFDEKLAWEKPCGGGITYKAWREYPFLIDNATPKKLVRRACLLSDAAGSAAIDLDRDLVVYSRYELNAMLLARAERAGARIEKARVVSVQRTPAGWTVGTREGSMHAGFCVLATGARNPFREIGTQWSPGDTMSSLGYFVPSSQDHIDLRFFSSFEGYIWVFPRPGHLSVGIAGKGKPASELKAMLHRYMAEQGIATRDAQFFGHVIPSLEKRSWPANRVAGDRWMAVGDAAGLVDPVTGEGLYYAVRSADLAARAIVESGVDAPSAYRAALSGDLQDLEIGARLSKRLFLGRFLYGDVTARMIQFMRRSPTVSGIVQDLFAGTQSYTTLKARLKSNMPRTARDLLTGWTKRKQPAK
jgi:geranylgeranyl reductase family protein